MLLGFARKSNNFLSVLQYLDGTTANPLVVDSNTTMVSDRRIFSSDGNKTMHA